MPTTIISYIVQKGCQAEEFIAYFLEKSCLFPVKRNTDRFPPDFMFQLTWQEFDNLKSQIVISTRGSMRRSRP
ncbi:MAG: ORF6N domain-containing protein [Planctomycetes bacterium]|nr:ORF6N domain-containing protein [Planctomycetota bacterium]